MNYVAEDFVSKSDLRNQLIDRIDVLNKVKELFLIPKLEMMTGKMVAEFYEVDPDTVKHVYQRNREESSVFLQRNLGRDILSHPKLILKLFQVALDKSHTVLRVATLK